MGLYALDETLRWILPPMDACEKWENTIKKCVAHGMYHLKKRLCIDNLNKLKFIFVYIRVVLIKVFCYCNNLYNNSYLVLDIRRIYKRLFALP